MMNTAPGPNREGERLRTADIEPPTTLRFGAIRIPQPDRGSASMSASSKSTLDKTFVLAAPVRSPAASTIVPGRAFGKAKTVVVPGATPRTGRATAVLNA